MTEQIPDQQLLYVNDGLSDEEIQQQADRYGPLTDSVRALIAATLQTEVDDPEIRRARELVEEATALLRAKAIPGPYGVRWGASGRKRAWGNAADGLRNAVAPPLDIQHDADGLGWAEFHLGPQYEGPAGLTHGGVSALILDQLLGDTAVAAGSPGMTGTLTLRYRRPTPLGRLRAEARFDRIEGVKAFVKGHIADADGVTVEAEGIFILPRWAREATDAAATAG
ncbi:PaaI family thioesterase [Rhodococcus sp. NPDC058505]|uniref:PaaI family thioesterase n=1 Tax=unclassified Rhodococcus (in: high G+C Gram-positive bacteria) TaxID=192944 RepID=UPI00365DA681